VAQIINLPRAALHGELTQRLRQMLVEGQIAPGAKINEREICEQLQVSRTPLREALKGLAAEGLVELRPNRGAVAVRLSAEDIRHTFEVMAGLEGLSGELAAQRISAEELAEIQALHFEMKAAYTRRDLSNYYRLNAAIHQHINGAAHNPVLAATYRQVNARLQALRFRSNQDGDKWARAMQEHDRMVTALQQRDGAALSAELVAHLHHKRDVVLEQLQSQPDSPPSNSEREPKAASASDVVALQRTPATRP
jgi:DNA-binding GntR family transcriptional regulator